MKSYYYALLAPKSSELDKEQIYFYEATCHYCSEMSRNLVLWRM